MANVVPLIRTGQPPSPSVGASGASPSTSVYFVHGKSGVEELSASAILAQVEVGALDTNTPISVAADRPPTPLRRHIRELVWLSTQENLHHRDASVDLSPFRVAFADAAVGMVLSDLKGRILHANPAFLNLLNWEAVQVEGTLVGDLSAAEDRDEEIKLGNALFRGEMRSFQLVKRFRCASGDWIPCLVSISLVRDVAGLPLYAVASVVDHREHQAIAELRAKVAEAEAVQALARGVAHDFNNTLLVIQSGAEMLEEDEGTTDFESVSAILQAVELARGLTARLHALSTAGTGTVSGLDLVAEVRAREAFLRHLAGTERNLVFRLGTGLARVRLDAAGIDQLLLNLVVNAQQATRPGDTIGVQVVHDGPTVRLEVFDTGRGMSEEVRLRAMEPFFTRREGGTGLGLAIVGATLARVGGRVDIQSKEGQGTRFVLTFPAMTADSAS